MAIELAKMDFSVYAIDFSRAMLDRAEHNLRKAGLIDRVRLICADILHDDVEECSSSAGLAIAMGLLEYVEDARAFFSKAVRYLVPGAVLIVEFRN